MSNTQTQIKCRLLLTERLAYDKVKDTYPCLYVLRCCGGGERDSREELGEFKTKREALLAAERASQVCLQVFGYRPSYTELI